MHTLPVVEGVECEWDDAKARANLAKHGVDFADAVAALEDDAALTIHDPDCTAEDRFITLGSDALGHLVVVVYTHRGERVRLISARKAEPKEQRRYGRPR